MEEKHLFLIHSQEEYTDRCVPLAACQSASFPAEKQVNNKKDPTGSPAGLIFEWWGIGDSMRTV